MEKTTGQTLENYKIEPFTLIHDILVNWWVIILGRWRLRCLLL